MLDSVNTHEGISQQFYSLSGPSGLEDADDVAVPETGHAMHYCTVEVNFYMY